MSSPTRWWPAWSWIGHRRRRCRPRRVHETTHETTHENPTYFVHDVLHYAVGNMPAVVPHTSTYALTNATFPYLVELVERGMAAAAAADRSCAAGFNTLRGHCTNAAVASALDLEWTDPMSLVSG